MRSSVRELISDDGWELIFGQLVDTVKGCILIEDRVLVWFPGDEYAALS